MALWLDGPDTFHCLFATHVAVGGTRVPDPVVGSRDPMRWFTGLGFTPFPLAGSVRSVRRSGAITESADVCVWLRPGSGGGCVIRECWFGVLLRDYLWEGYHWIELIE